MGTLNTGYLIITSVLLGGIIYVLMYHTKRRRLYKQAADFRGPLALPLVGNALKFLGSTEDILNNIKILSALYPSPYRVWLGPELMIFISEPEHVKKILCSDLCVEKADFYRFFRPWLGNGLFSAPAAIWRVHRKLIGPTFNLKILESFVAVFAAQAKTMVQKMEIKSNGSEFEIFGYTSECMLKIICETAMGVTMDRQTTSGCDSYVEAAEKALSIVYQRIFKAWLHPDLIFDRTQLGKEQRECIKTLHGFTDAVIRRKREASLNRNHQTTIVGQVDDAYNPSRQRKAYLDLLMELSDGETQFSDAELREEVDTMIIAGNDTTSNAVCFLMLMLASHSDVQEKVYQELCDIYGTCDIDELNVTHEDLPRMEYMERVIKETLRLFPIGPFIARTPVDDFNIGEYTLPKRSFVVIEILTIHRSEKYWHNPLKFDPDRFLPEEIAKRDSYCYLPFSAGPRICIGARFAMMEMKTIIATVLWRYVLKKDNVVPISEIKLKADTMLKSVDPITLRIERRRAEI